MSKLLVHCDQLVILSFIDGKKLVTGAFYFHRNHLADDIVVMYLIK